MELHLQTHYVSEFSFEEIDLEMSEEDESHPSSKVASRHSSKVASHHSSKSASHASSNSSITEIELDSNEKNDRKRKSTSSQETNSRKTDGKKPRKSCLNKDETRKEPLSMKVEEKRKQSNSINVEENRKKSSTMKVEESRKKSSTMKVEEKKRKLSSVNDMRKKSSPIIKDKKAKRSSLNDESTPKQTSSPKYYKCFKCDSMIGHYSNLLFHFGTSHFHEEVRKMYGSEEWSCSLCPEDVTSEKQLIRHLVIYFCFKILLFLRGHSNNTCSFFRTFWSTRCLILPSRICKSPRALSFLINLVLNVYRVIILGPPPPP